MGLTEEQRRGVEDLAELTVRRYFDHFLEEVLPKIQATVIATHDADEKAHDGVAKKVNRGLWLATGAGAVMGLGGVPAVKAFLGMFG
jgi:hypothetical protein